METMAAKMYRLAAVAPRGDRFIIGGVQQWTVGWQGRGMRYNTFGSASVNEKTLSCLCVCEEGEVVAGGDSIDTPPPN
jgi:hypothetical protein